MEPVNKVPKNGNWFYIVTPEDKTLPKGEPLIGAPTLEKLQKGVGGDIELVPLFTNIGGRACVAFCHEHEKFKPHKRNILAHMFWEFAVGRPIGNDYLAGNIVIIVGDRNFIANL